MTEEPNLSPDYTKLKIWLGFSKFILGTFILGICGLLINCSIEDRQLKLKESVREEQSLEKFLGHAVDQSIDKRIRFAHYFSRVSTHEDKRKLWTNFYNELLGQKRQLEGEREDIISKFDKAGLPEKLTFVERLHEIKSELQPAFANDFNPDSLGNESDSDWELIKNTSKKIFLPPGKKAKFNFTHESAMRVDLRFYNNNRNTLAGKENPPNPWEGEFFVDPTGIVFVRISYTSGGPAGWQNFPYTIEQTESLVIKSEFNSIVTINVN